MVFRFILWSVGALLSIASRLNPRLRAQITRDMIVSIATRDGVARSYVFRDRHVSSHAGTSDEAKLTATFPSASVGTRIFLAPNAVEQIVEGLTSKDIELEGMPAHVLWFYEMVMAYLPWRKTRYTAAPNAYVEPDPQSKVADRITREPAEKTLDPNWAGAVAQREKLDMWRVGEGAPVPGRIPDFRYVVDIPATRAEASS